VQGARVDSGPQNERGAALPEAIQLIRERKT
jgi:hypothetical protein